jgi:hypothetical protein
VVAEVFGRLNLQISYGVSSKRLEPDPKIQQCGYAEVHLVRLARG